MVHSLSVQVKVLVSVDLQIHFAMLRGAISKNTLIRDSSLTTNIDE
ncbi:unnamed protein product [Acanthoscelides obtectus]|uniref:Uncharacterized protein n=1 Tax=Acanthoscelides obtectus TaxID=200917 RepID=A0A9P0MKD4_ACAOB|nr:unnamed protein product [Acanthoscelides obtectus]CAH2015044.1 unnamed protein product [Acanthoscelides obtectus]CAK1623576.1 hypothetical protein AOBTE_LOCUS2080 [Acanthoscelides obtectus]CAK1623589.1 hypothetical protein AOBTE_LOCUS2087 [Acanthoscelides obtectus]